MKKILIVLAIIVTVLSLNKQTELVIPKESIRFRVIANSNSENDQLLKKRIIYNLNQKVKEIQTISNSISSSRNVIKENIPELEKIVETTIQESSTQVPYKINYGNNYFPPKTYKGVTYEEGEYESLVITLGDGLGENFWCVLFPPLCLIEAENEAELDEIEYTSIIKEIIDKYF